MVSYGFYLWHLPVFFAVRFFDPHWNDVVRVVVAVAVTLTLTLSSWFLLERPLMNWSRRLEQARFPKSPTAGMEPQQSTLSSTSAHPGSEVGDTPESAINADTFGVTEHPPP